MKKTQIRQNVFETNSSSTHSISVAMGDKSCLTDIPKLNDEGNIEVNSGEYGWEECTYQGNVYDRLSYAATYALNHESVLNLLTNIIKKYTGANEVIYDPNVTDKYYGHGYIDHQSIDEIAEIFESEELLEAFLFNPKSYFKTDNDNH